MKKLKAWQIVLLVIFYPIGIIVLIYRLIKKSQLKQRAAAEQVRIAAEKQALQAQEEAKRKAILEEVRKYEDFTFKIAGVTFKNNDGKSRQVLLRKLKRQEPPFSNGEVDLDFKEYDYKGEPAVGVYLAGQQVGNIAKDDLPSFLSRMDRFERCLSYDVTGGGTRNGEKMNYGLKLFLRFRREETA